MAALGYARVSTKAQRPDLQVGALKAAGCAEVFTDRTASGTLARRPQLDELLARVEDGDEIVVWKLDRLGRNTHNLLLLLDEMKSRGVHFRSLTEGISTTGAMGTAMATVMDADTLAVAQARHANGENSTQIAKALGVSRASIYRHLPLSNP